MSDASKLPDSSTKTLILLSVSRSFLKIQWRGIEPRHRRRNSSASRCLQTLKSFDAVDYNKSDLPNQAPIPRFNAPEMRMDDNASRLSLTSQIVTSKPMCQRPLVALWYLFATAPIIESSSFRISSKILFLYCFMARMIAYPHLLCKCYVS